MHLNHISLYGLSLVHVSSMYFMKNSPTSQLASNNSFITMVDSLMMVCLVHVWSIAILVYDLKQNSDHVDWDLTLSTSIKKKQTSFVLVISINHKSANLQRSKPRREKNAIRVLKVVESFSSGLSVHENWWSNAFLISINSSIWSEAKLR